ncbi:MAG: O-antigen ligase family protein [Kastovskya adunca ATA6-11-RM4]|jgi:hypothetical protein|nr:O-antigen ligase family protein [Kastovskya adunca ATA6-11-RM4]
MGKQPSVSNISQQTGFQLQPKQAWAAILGLVLFTTVGIVAGAGKILNFLCPMGALAVGALLYFRYPVLYVSFSWWLWFLSPLIRRLADFRSSYTESSPMLLAPYLVAGLTVITLWKHLSTAHRQGGLPFVLSFLGVIYGLLIGLVTSKPVALAEPFLAWLIPVTFGFHLFMNWREYPSYRQNIQRTFLWGVLIMGIYGIVQFVSLPEWDRLWLDNSGLASAGTSENGEVRVWSTMNSGEPFAAYMAGGLLLLFSCQSPLLLPASVSGFLSFFLSTVRSAWLGWFAGAIALAAFLKQSLQIRLIAVVAIIALCVIPLTTMEPFSEKISNRIESLSNIEEDRSATVRRDMYDSLLGVALSKFVGDGLGNGVGDSGFLSMFFQIGWFGVIFYMGGMILLVLRLFQGSEGSFDLFAAAARAIVVSCLVRLPVNGVIGGGSGVLLWGFIGIGIAANKYYKHQRLANRS